MAATRQLAAIMFTDMVGYTALMQENEQLAIQKRERNKTIFENALSRFEGKLLQYYGDGTMSIFSSAVNAVKAAIEIQTLNLQEPKIEVRIGIHIGDVMFDDTGIYGDSVNVASRIETLAVSGSVFISEKMYEEIKNQEGMQAMQMGYFELKNVKQPVQVYAVSNSGIVVPSRDEVKGKVKQTLNSIAVLPFANLSSDPENEFFCDGITEELLNVLAKVDGLQVTSRTSSFAYKGKHDDIREIAAKLNVQRIIEGSVRKFGNKVRVTVQLINAADGYHFWSENYDRNLDDIFEIQDDISRAIANRLRENLTTEQHQSQLAKAPTENLEAYKKYLQGVQLWDRAEPQQRKLAMDLFLEAANLDPDFVNANAFLAISYSFMGQIGMMNAAEAFRLAHDYAEKALKKGNNSAFAWSVMSFLKLYDWEWKEGFEMMKKSLELNPNDPMAHLIAAEYYLLFNNFEMMLEHAQKCYELDPLSANNIGEVARHMLFMGKADEAIKLTEEAILLDSGNLVSRNIHAYARAINGDPKGALAEMEAVHKIAGDFPLVLLAMGIIYTFLNDKEKAMEIVAKFEMMMQQMPEANLDFAIALICINIGEMEKFLKAYDRSLERKGLWLLQFYTSEMMKPVWYNEHVVATRKKLGLPVKE